MSLPTTMHAVEISEPGGPEVLKPCEAQVPTPGPGEVLIQVEVAGVNRPDCLQRAGAYPPPPGASPLPGLEVAGTIAALGEGVRRWQIGDAVCALTPGGGYAAYCTTHADHCLPIPSGYDMVKAAALPETMFTVYYNLFTRARLTAGEVALVHGGSSGIGTTAIQLGKAFGARMLTTAGSADKCAFCESLGAELAINYRETEDWKTAIKGHTEGAGVDVVLDMVGGPYIRPNIDVLKRDGRYAFIAFLKGPKAEVDFSKLMLKRLTVSGSTLRPQTDAEKAVIAADLLRDVWPLLESGRVKPILHETFALDEAAKAHALMESSTHIGKIMLAVG